MKNIVIQHQDKGFFKEKVSVIVPVYNSSAYLEACVQSIASQSYQNLEILLIDDGSTDSSAILATKLSKQDPRVKVFEKTINTGRSATRNFGLDHASGEYVVFVDSDDELVPNAITRMIKKIKIDGSDGVVGSIVVEYEAHSELKDSDDSYYKIKFNAHKKVTDDLLFNFHASSCGVLFKTEKIRNLALRYPEGLNYEDAYFHWVYFSQCLTISFLSTPVYKYIRRPVSIMSQTFERAEGIAIQHLYIAEHIFRFWEARGELQTRYPTVFRLLEEFFWSAYRYSQNYEKALVVYECSKIIRNFNLPLGYASDSLKQIYEGNYGFLFPNSSVVQGQNEQTSQDFARFLQLKSIINSFFPNNTFRRKVIISIGRKVLKRKKHK